MRAVVHLDPKITSHLANYVGQSALASMALLVVLFVERAVLGPAIMVAIASTGFIVFAVPHSVAAHPRKVIGGHVVGAAVGSGLAFLMVALGWSWAGAGIGDEFIAALSVGLGMFLMAATNTEHPPAAGTALALVIDGWQWSTVAFILVGATVLTVIRLMLLRRMVNLL